MNKILVPTDFSQHSKYALEYASFIAKEKGSELIVLHITNQLETQELNENFEEVRNCSYLEGVDFICHTEKGSNVSTLINKVGIEFAIDLIIMGSNGISDISEMILGSNTENVIRDSEFTVITIKTKMMGLNFNSILFPSDFMPETYSIFETVMEYAHLFKAKIYLLNVSTPDDSTTIESITEKMEMLIDYYQLDSTSLEYEKAVYNDKNEELGIISYAINQDIDVIAIGSHGKSVLHKLIHESTSQNLVRDSFRPIMTMRFS